MADWRQSRSATLDAFLFFILHIAAALECIIAMAHRKRPYTHSRPISTAYLVSRKYTVSIPRFFSRKHCAMPSRISSLAIDSLSLSALGSVFDIKDCDVSFARIDSGALRLSLSVCM